MKFLVTKDLGHSKLLGFLMGMVVFSIFLYLLLDIFVHGYVLGWDIESISTTLYGNIETFEEPILIDSLLLQVHIDLFMGIFSLLILTAIWIRFCVKKLTLKWVLHTVLLFGLLSPLFLLLAYMGNTSLLYLWLCSFFLWHGIAIVIIMMIFRKLILR